MIAGERPPKDTGYIMKIKNAFVFFILALSLPAAAEFTTVSRAYEVALSNITVPATMSSNIMFRSCAKCDMTTVRLSPSTQFVVNGQSVTLKDFRKSVFQVRDRARKVVIIRHHLESDTIEYVSVRV